MAQLTEKDLVGKVQDWSEIIANVESDACPATTMANKRTRPKQVEHMWQMENYKSVGHAGVMDGEDAKDFGGHGRQQATGICQKIWDKPGISDFADEAQIAGLSKGEWAHQIALSAVAAKWAIEKRFLSDEDQKLEAHSTNPKTPNETRGLVSWANPSAQAQYPVHADFRPAAAQSYTGALNAFDESDFLALARSSYKARRGPSRMDFFLGIDLKARFTDFSMHVEDVTGQTLARTFNQDTERAIIRTIDKLVLDTGEAHLHPSTFLCQDRLTGDDSAYTHRSGVGFDMEQVGLAFTRKPSFRQLENKGGGPRGIFDAIFLVMVDNPKASIRIYINSDN